MVLSSRRVAVALCSLLALAGPGTALATDFRAAGVSDSVHDPAGDAESDDGSAANQPEADIIDAGVQHRGADIVFTIKVDRPTDPATTKNWEGDTMAAWAVDTTGDNSPDYLVAFGRDDAGQLTVQAVRLDEQGTQNPCAGTAAVGSDGTFAATVPAGCLGDPASFRYGAAMSWDTDPANDAAPGVSDSAPNDDNLAGPVTKP